MWVRKIERYGEYGRKAKVTSEPCGLERYIIKLLICQKEISNKINREKQFLILTNL
ncbi:hypothetical protein SULYE_1670 [Sulfurihydrogenibium yellowstonense SS-5]|uniref:Uncharacterized protein n=1 Tax=Sulfurihydrogenibium yellowstonense SS-5 TaxID=432331 RepID=C4FM66_9AQUI|nr:hypothetical protein SULYE_1670 [Sulfurihydrogenibium yellowstonense SS-5]